MDHDSQDFLPLSTQANATRPQINRKTKQHPTKRFGEENTCGSGFQTQLWMLQQSRHYTWWYCVHRPWLCRWCGTFYTRLRKVAGRSQAFRQSSNHHGPAHFMGINQITEHRSRSPPQSVSAVCGCHGPVCLSGQHCCLDWLLQYRHPTTSWSCIFSDGSARPSLACEPAESSYIIVSSKAKLKA